MESNKKVLPAITIYKTKEDKPKSRFTLNFDQNKTTNSNTVRRNFKFVKVQNNPADIVNGSTLNLNWGLKQ